MNCWKTINLSRDFGANRLTVLSVIVAFLAFTIIYLPLSIINESIQLHDDRLIFFIISLIFIIPAHHLCHAIPVLFTFKKVNISMTKNTVIPAIRIHYKDSLSKTLTMLSMAAPTFLITLPLIICAILYPIYMHYFTLISAFNLGLSVIDFIYLTALIRAPSHCFVDHTHSSFDILIKDD